MRYVDVQWQRIGFKGRIRHRVRALEQLSYAMSLHRVIQDSLYLAALFAPFDF